MISDPSQVLLDSVTVRPNIKTHSRGRETDGSGNWSVFLVPTPNASNSGFFRIFQPRIFNSSRILYRFQYQVLLLVQILQPFIILLMERA